MTLDRFVVPCLRPLELLSQSTHFLKPLLVTKTMSKQEFGIDEKDRIWKHFSCAQICRYSKISWIP